MKTVIKPLRALRFLTTVVAGFALSATLAHAASVTVKVVDQNGAPVPDAVIYAQPVSGKAPASKPAPAIIDQIKRRFVPMVSVVQTGAAVTFPNKDDIEHDVYSFSPAKRFELNLYHGIPAKPVVFDKPGLVVMGCNIHDSMIAYLLIVETPYFAKTDKSGMATITNLPAEPYRVIAWHFRQTDPNAQPGKTVSGSADSSATFALTLKPAE